MAVALNPYLSFRGQAREAMEFYKGVFGGDLTISTFGDFGAAADPGETDLVMHSDLEGPDGLRFMGADSPLRMEHTPGNNISMSLSGDDGGSLHGWFEGLSDGGTVTQPLEKAGWGDTFGMVVDRFGINWLVNIAAPKE